MVQGIPSWLVMSVGCKNIPGIWTDDDSISAQSTLVAAMAMEE
jgi:hypothetical protein